MSTFTLADVVGFEIRLGCFMDPFSRSDHARGLYLMRLYRNLTLILRVKNFQLSSGTAWAFSINLL